ncbi:MAG: hypothetical protein WD512_00770, partial [Candidatus Paceibacterota bacterium]
EVLSPKEIENILNGMVYNDSRVQQQLDVDTWSTFKGADEVKLSEQFKSFAEEEKKQYEDARTRIQTGMKSAKTSEEKEAYAEQLKAYNAAITNLNTDLGSWDDVYSKNADSYKKMYYMKQFTQGLQSLFAKNNLTEISSITDQEALANLNHANAKEQIKLKSDLDKLTDIQKLFIEAEKTGTQNGLASALNGIKLDIEKYYPGQGFSSWKDIADRITAEQTPIAFDFSLGLADQKDIDILKEHTNTKNELGVKALELDAMFEDKGLSFNKNRLEHTKKALEWQIKDAEKNNNTALVVELGKLKDNLKEYSKLNNQLEGLDNYGVENLLEKVEASGNAGVPLGDGTTLFYTQETGTYYLQDKVRVGERVESSLAGKGTNAKGILARNASKFSFLNLAPKKEMEKRTRLDSALNNIDDEIKRITTLKNENKINKVTADEAISLLTKHKGKNVDDLSWWDAGNLYNKLDNITSGLNATALFTEGRNLSNSKQPNLNNGVPLEVTKNEVLGILKQVVTQPKTKKEAALAASS